MRKKFQLGILIFLISALSFSYNACTQQVSIDFQLTPTSSSTLTPPSTESPASTDIVPDITENTPMITGQKLYEINCTACHGSLANSDRIGKTVNDITLAIQNNPSMFYLSTLTSDQISQIATALTPSTTPSDPNSGVTIRIVVSNRYQLASQLKQFFVSSSNPTSSDTQIQTVIDNLITKHPEGFGGNCTRNDPGCTPSPCGSNSTCKGNLNTSQNADVNPTSSAIRKGYLIQACEQILSIDKSISNLANQAGVDTNVQPTSNSIANVSTLIYRNRNLDTSTLSALLNLTTSLKTTGMSNLDQWRMVMLTLCQTSSTDLL